MRGALFYIFLWWAALVRAKVGLRRSNSLFGSKVTAPDDQFAMFVVKPKNGEPVSYFFSAQKDWEVVVKGVEKDLQEAVPPAFALHKVTSTTADFSWFMKDHPQAFHVPGMVSATMIDNLKATLARSNNHIRPNLGHKQEYGSSNYMPAA
eukprot:Platyproteum_vivax@DN8396_c0_g1_i1.p1